MWWASYTALQQVTKTHGCRLRNDALLHWRMGTHTMSLIQLMTKAVRLMAHEPYFTTLSMYINLSWLHLSFNLIWPQLIKFYELHQWCFLRVGLRFTFHILSHRSVHICFRNAEYFIHIYDNLSVRLYQSSTDLDFDNLIYCFAVLWYHNGLLITLIEW